MTLNDWWWDNFKFKFMFKFIISDLNLIEIAGEIRKGEIGYSRGKRQDEMRVEFRDRLVMIPNTAN